MAVTNVSKPAAVSSTWLRWTLLAIAAVAAAYVIVLSGGPQSTEHFTGLQAKDFALNRLDGAQVRWADLAGKPVVLAFWALGCPPCRAEAPHLSDLAVRHAAQDLVVLGINAWDEPRSAISDFVAQAQLKHIILLGGSQVAQAYGVQSLPLVLWIDRDGRIVAADATGNRNILEKNTVNLLSKK